MWINLHDLFHPLKNAYEGETGCFLWASERSGFRHLYLMDQRGEPIRALTNGEWMVDAIAGVDEEHRLVYFTATKESPLECHLYVTSFNGEEARRITQEAGTIKSFWIINSGFLWIPINRLTSLQNNTCAPWKTATGRWYCLIKMMLVLS